MRLFLLLLGLLPLLALGLDLYFKERAQERDARLVATANRLLIEATAPSQAARTVEIRRIAEAEPGVWQVQGHIILEEADPAQRSAFSVEIEQRCGNLKDDACWRPHALVIGEERLLDERSPPIAVAETAPVPATPPDIARASSLTSVTETTIETQATEAPAATVESQPDGGFVAAITDESTAEADSDSAQAMPTEPEASVAEQAAELENDASDGNEGQVAALETVEMSVEESLIWLIQDRLAMLGYGEPGTLRPSGVLDAPTRAAIDAYQYAHGLRRDGEPSFELLDRIQAEARQRGALAAADTAQQPDGPQVAEQALPQAPAASDPAVPAPAQAASTQAAPAQTAETAPVQAPPAPTADAETEPQVAASEVAAPTAAEAEPESAATKTATPLWDTTGAAGTTAAALAELEEQVVPAAGDSAEPESDETLPDAQGDAELEPIDLLPANPEPPQSATAAPQQARVPEPADAAPEPQAAAEEAEETDSADESLVFLIQDRLNRLGYDKPTPIALDGRMDSRTRLAIFDFQQKNRLPKDGKPSEELLRHLEATLLGQRSGATANSE